MLSHKITFLIFSHLDKLMSKTYLNYQSYELKKKKYIYIYIRTLI